jgi:hypothetical protein
MSVFSVLEVLVLEVLVLEESNVPALIKCLSILVAQKTSLEGSG